MVLNKKLLSLAFIIVLGELLLVTFLINATRGKITENLIIEESEKERVIAQQISRSLKQDLEAVQNKLSLIALFPEIQTGSGDACNKKLDSVFPLVEKKVANLVRINEKGELYCAIVRASIGIDVLENEDLKKLLQTPEHKPVLHRIVLSPVSKKYVAGMHVPVFSEKGKFKGSIGGVIYFNELEKKYFKDFKFLERGRLMLLDDNGDVLYHNVYPKRVGQNSFSDEILAQLSALDREDYKSQLTRILEDAKKNKVGFFRYHYSPNPEMIAVYQPVEILENRHWVVVVAVPVEDIINQVDKHSLIAGFQSFSALTLITVTVVFITQISLFVYLLVHMSWHIRKMRAT